MEPIEVSFHIETLPLSIRQHLQGAKIFDSSCSENAKTLFISGEERAFLKIGNVAKGYRL